MKFVAYSTSTLYNGYNHAPAQGQPGHGNIVRHKNDNELGNVINSNTERSLVQFGNRRDWYPNSDLLIREDFIAN